MLNKSKIILPADDDEVKLCLMKACDLYTKASFTSKAFYTKFLSPLEARCILQRFPKDDVNIRLFGGYDEFERCVCAFYTYDEDLTFPVAALKVKSKSKNSSLSHRDYLGSVLSLGIKRELVGDIVIRENEAIVFCLEEIADFIADNLTKIANTGVSIKKEENIDDINIKRDFDIISSTVSSLRCDSVVASALNLSRSKAAELIERGYVIFNYEQAKSAAKVIKDGDVFSVRGYGKFRVQTDGSLTRKGRIHINIFRYK